MQTVIVVFEKGQDFFDDEINDIEFSHYQLFINLLFRNLNFKVTKNDGCLEIEIAEEDYNFMIKNWQHCKVNWIE